MPRMARLKIKGEMAYYHIVSHTVWEAQRAFTGMEKERFISLLRKLTEAYFIEVISYTILDNHFHLLVRTLPSAELSDEEVIFRAKKIFGNITVFLKPPAYWREKLEDVSSFVKDLKGRYAQRYNREHDRNGHLWSNRFKSILIESGKAALAVAAYIDLNPVRAGISKGLSSYRHSSYTARLAGENWLLPLPELYEGLDLKRYKKFLEEEGKIEREGKASLKKKEKGIEELASVLRYRGEGIVFGGRGFVESMLGKVKKVRKSPGRTKEGLYIV